MWIIDTLTTRLELTVLCTEIMQMYVFIKKELLLCCTSRNPEKYHIFSHVTATLVSKATFLILSKLSGFILWNTTGFGQLKPCETVLTFFRCIIIFSTRRRRRREVGHICCPRYCEVHVTLASSHFSVTLVSHSISFER